MQPTIEPEPAARRLLHRRRHAQQTAQGGDEAWFALAPNPNDAVPTDELGVYFYGESCRMGLHKTGLWPV